MGSVCVSSCRCCMFVSCMHPVAVLNAAFTTCSLLMLVEDARSDHMEGSKRHSLQAVELPQRTQAAVQIVSNLPAPSNGGPIYRFLGMPAMRTRWMSGAVAHKSG